MNRYSLIVSVLVSLFLFTGSTQAQEITPVPTDEFGTETSVTSPWSTEPDPLQIEQMRQRTYPGSEITFEQTLNPGRNYNQYVVSYLSDGYRINALMTIPFGPAPETGWPVIVFNHGYIEPSIYRTTERYVDYVRVIAENGYIVFKSDYRGHGSSEGGPEIGGGYGTPDYTVDILNAVTSLQNYQDADPDRIGMWGHSMGGQVTLRAMVVSPDIKAGVIWAGVVVSYPEIIERWDFARFFDESDQNAAPQSEAFRWGSSFSSWVSEFTTRYGTAEENPEFWATVSPNSYLTDLSGPIQLHQSTEDRMVPMEWAQTLADELEAVEQPHELYIYEGDNHNISVNFTSAMTRTVNYFDRYVKNQP